MPINVCNQPTTSFCVIQEGFGVQTLWTHQIRINLMPSSQSYIGDPFLVLTLYTYTFICQIQTPNKGLGGQSLLGLRLYNTNLSKEFDHHKKHPVNMNI